MGEYFCVYLRKNENNTVRYYPKDPKIAEFCWHKTSFSMLITSLLYKNPMRMAVVGDEITYASALRMAERFGREQKDHPVTRKDTDRMLLYGKKIVNHSKKEYLDYDSYADRSINGLGLVPNPLFFLTVYPECYICERMPQAGLWSEDYVSVEDDVPEGYEKKEYSFPIQIGGVINPKSGLIEGPDGDKNLNELLNSDYIIIEELASDLGWYVGEHGNKVTFDYLNSPMDSFIELPLEDLMLNMIEMASYPFDSPVHSQFVELVRTLISENEKAHKYAEYYDL